MLPIYIHPSFEGISIRTVTLPRDAGDLIEIHMTSDYGPHSPLRPTISTMELFYRRFLDWSAYGAYLLSYRGTTLFLLELIPIDHTDLGYYYEPAFFDYSIGITLGIDSNRTEEAVLALSAAITGIFAENPEIYRLVSRVMDGAPEGLLRTVLERAGFEQLAGQVEMKEPAIYVRWRGLDLQERKGFSE
jgi:hypothetical protein